ncbi:unnamed protein product [Prunus armeniaca]|uniref:Lipoxygenase domain-containing protein n=1 Tax=Prunus armeniaca TaxID=36596 RepID=A0A6J5UPW0_PRUAR|nr:unnamed protein product [Prunus armeniaca]
MPSDRIYHYNTYNDIGNPDKGIECIRPTLGGNKNPHPRHCRTGRLPTKTDDEFGRQAVAGINPLSIERLTVFPPVSKLDPSIYGPQESALKEEHLKGHLDAMSVQQAYRMGMSNALEENKLFILDCHHDMFLPFLNQINALEDRKAYGTRTILFLTSLGTLKPIEEEIERRNGDLNLRNRCGAGVSPYAYLRGWGYT